MKMGKNSNAVGHIKPDRVICCLMKTPGYAGGGPIGFE